MVGINTLNGSGHLELGKTHCQNRQEGLPLDDVSAYRLGQRVLPPWDPIDGELLL